MGLPPLFMGFLCLDLFLAHTAEHMGSGRQCAKSICHESAAAPQQLHFRDIHLLEKRLAQFSVEGPLRAWHSFDGDPGVWALTVRAGAVLGHDLVDRDGEPLR